MERGSGTEVGAARIGRRSRIDGSTRLRCSSAPATHHGGCRGSCGWIDPEPPPALTPPDGIRLRPFEPGDEDETLAMFERAFSEWDDRVANAPGTWRAMVTEREGFRPDDLLLATAGDRIVRRRVPDRRGRDWVDKLAVERRVPASWDRAHAAASGLRPLVRPRLSLDERCPPTLTRGRCPSMSGWAWDPPLVHASLARPAVTRPTRWPRDSNPRGSQPPYTLSRRVPSAARAGHRGESTEATLTSLIRRFPSR